MNARPLMLAPLLALAFGLGAAQAQTTGVGPSVRSSQPAVVPAKKDDVARADRKFIAAAAGSGMFEVHVSQLAASKANDANVKAFATMLVDQHKAANDELVRIASEKKVELPAAPKRSLRREIDKLGKKSGDAFDRAFVREVGIQAHEKDIKLFQDARKHVKDPDLKAFVEKTLPVLQDHLAAAKKLPQAGRK
jgi:putative membrane protein